MIPIFKKIILSIFLLSLSFDPLFSQFGNELVKIKSPGTEYNQKGKKNNTYIIGKEPGISYQVILSSEMAEALKRYEKKYNNGYSYYIFNAENFKKEIIDNYPFGKFRLPSAVFGDFNGDGIIDVVLMGYWEGGGREHSAIMIESNPTNKENKKEEKYIVKEIVLYNQIENVNLYLTFHKKGEVITMDRKIMDCARETNGVITLKTDAFGIQNFDLEGRETLYNIDEYSSFGCIILK